MNQSEPKTVVASARLSAAVVDPSDTDAPTYGMFEVERLQDDGAFLVGSIFFERGEEFTVEISADGAAPVRVRAKVLDHRRDAAPGMSIRFQGLTAADRQALSALGRAG